MRRLTILTALLFALPANARNLGVPPDKGWQHASTGLILMPSIDGLPRAQLIDSGEDELDIAAQYGSNAEVTIYLFHPGLDDVALWFDRVETTIRERKIYAGVSAATPEPVAFRRPGSLVADSLKRSYSIPQGTFHSTAAAMMPLGEWLVAVRVSSATDDAVASAARLDRIIAGIRFPPQAPAGWPAEPVKDCTVRLAFAHAKLLKPDNSQTLLGAISTLASKDTANKPPPKAPEPFCRDRPGSTAFGVYRHNDQTRAYWVTFGDAGQAASVSGGLSALLGKGDFQVTLLTFAGTDVFPSFDKLPEPEQVVSLIGSGQRLS